MANYVISDTSLGSVADAIRERGGTSGDLSFPDGFVSAIKAIPSDIKLIYSGEFDDSYSGTSVGTALTISLPSSYYTDSGVLYAKVRDKAGRRAGYFYGSDTFIFNLNAASGSTGAVSMNNNTGTIALTHRTSSSGDAAVYGSYLAYGIYATNLRSTGQIDLKHRYNASYSLTINGTYTYEFYLITGPFLDWSGI